MKRINAKCVEMVVYETTMQQAEFFNSRVIAELEGFKKLSDVIIANRISKDQGDVVDRVYTLDFVGGWMIFS